jgi:hypothetical protein
MSADGDVLIPGELVLPTKTGDFRGKAGTIFLSGAKLHFNPTDGAEAETVTSS